MTKFIEKLNTVKKEDWAIIPAEHPANEVMVTLYKGIDVKVEFINVIRMQSEGSNTVSFTCRDIVLVGAIDGTRVYLERFIPNSEIRQIYDMFSDKKAEEEKVRDAILAEKRDLAKQIFNRIIND